jgi:hypothetical protein
MEVTIIDKRFGQTLASYLRRATGYLGLTNTQEIMLHMTIKMDGNGPCWLFNYCNRLVNYKPVLSYGFYFSASQCYVLFQSIRQVFGVKIDKLYFARKPHNPILER